MIDEPVRRADAPGSQNLALRVQPIRESLSALLRWREQIIDEIDQSAVVEKVRSESGWSARYAFMIAMSAGIAILGLLLSSPAVVIGAMLLSPLMGPIIGAGFALAIGDIGWLKYSAKALLSGTLVASAFCAFIVVLSPLQTVTEEIAARTRPNLFDLVVALFSALAGAYSMIRGREGTIVGVAIATALMPPLAVVGFGLATWNWTVFGGALLLFFTNLMTIALSAAVMARLYGFRTSLSPKQSMMQTVVIVSIFVGLAIPLGFSLRQIAWESNASRQARSVITDQFDSLARLSAIDIDFAGDPTRVTATVLTPEFVPKAQALATRILSRTLDEPIEVTINQYRVGTDSGDAEAAELAAARLREQTQASERAVTRMVDRVALIAGVGTENVTVDRDNKRAIVKAETLPSAGLAAYFALEERVAKLEPEWTLHVRPPAAELPDLEIKKGEVGDEGARRLDLVAWAAKRIDAPIGVGGRAALADKAVAELRARGAVAVRKADQPARWGTVTFEWLAPDEQPDASGATQ